MSDNVNGQEIHYQIDGEQFTGYYAVKNDGGSPRPGIIIVHEWWGHNDYVRMRAEKFAELGYAAFALDMYGSGKCAKIAEEAEALMNTTFASPDIIPTRFDAAVETLKQQAECDSDKIAAAGYCYGGAVVLNMARAGKKLAAVTSYHGLLETETPLQAGGFDGKIAVFTGADDPMVNPDILANFKAEMDNTDADYTVTAYPKVLHGFTNPAATARGEKFGLPLRYDEHADTDSWQQTHQILATAFA